MSSWCLKVEIQPSFFPCSCTINEISIMDAAPAWMCILDILKLLISVKLFLQANLFILDFSISKLKPIFWQTHEWVMTIFVADTQHQMPAGASSTATTEPSPPRPSQTSTLPTKTAPGRFWPLHSGRSLLISLTSTSKGTMWEGSISCRKQTKWN